MIIRKLVSILKTYIPWKHSYSNLSLSTPPQKRVSFFQTVNTVLRMARFLIAFMSYQNSGINSLQEVIYLAHFPTSKCKHLATELCIITRNECSYYLTNTALIWYEYHLVFCINVLFSFSIILSIHEMPRYSLPKNMKSTKSTG